MEMYGMEHKIVKVCNIVRTFAPVFNDAVV
jgi:hypothetical protein